MKLWKHAFKHSAFQIGAVKYGAVAFTTAIALSASHAGAQDTAPDKAYVSIFGGANISAGSSSFTNNQTSVDTDFDSGLLIGGAVGYKWNSLSFAGFSPRTEFEFSYSENGVGTVDFSGNGAGNEALASGSNVSAFSAFANVFIDADTVIGNGITPYIGGGIGISRTNFDIVYGGAGLNLNDTSTSFAWHVTGGVKYALSDRTSVFTDVGYRQIVNANSIRRRGATALSGAAGGNFEDSIDNVAVRVGLSVDF